MAKLVVLIESETKRGLGQRDSDPVRIVRQWWTPEGEFVFEKDPIDEPTKDRAMNTLMHGHARKAAMEFFEGTGAGE